MLDIAGSCNIAMISYIGSDFRPTSGVTKWDNVRESCTRLLNECLIKRSQGGLIIVQSGALFLIFSSRFVASLLTDQNVCKSPFLIEIFSACTFGKLLRRLKVLSTIIRMVREY